ncbi:MAG TPA: DUF6289 family protein [Candidatus Angelobacter sp.]|nr:DUF6289 family protein [Candidatus Angelobacter sp.]
MKIASARLSRLVVLAALFLIGFASPFSTKDAQAQTGKLGNEFDYYSDSTYSTLVGYRIFCNSGQTFIWGTTSRYVIVSPAGC